VKKNEKRLQFLKQTLTDSPPETYRLAVGGGGGGEKKIYVKRTMGQDCGMKDSLKIRVEK